MTAAARYVMIGGFLGAGKTTAVAGLARALEARGLKVGLITNDQSSGLVDTTLLASRGFAVEEIAGGCFCCRFASLSEAAERLTASVRPDVFIAEPVGSCTDLVATVSYPLRRIYGERFTIAPLSVLVDPARAMRVFGLAPGRAFSEKVVYVYLKQLEEADLIVVNKADRLTATDREKLTAALSERFPRAEVLVASALEGEGTETWFARLLAETGATAPTMALDYSTYAEGEALLGWLNATVRVSSASSGEAQGDDTFDANAFLVDLAEHIRQSCATRDIEIAHLKATLDIGDASGRLAALSLTATDGDIDLREALIDGVRGGELVVNLRAEAAPEVLHEATRAALDAAAAARGLVLAIEHEEHFRPAPPEPPHRVIVGTSSDGVRS